MESTLPYKIFFISESAVTIDFGNVIDRELNKKVIDIFNYLSRHPLAGMIEAIPAYSSLSIYFDIVLLRKRLAPTQRVYEWIYEELNKLLHNDLPDSQTEKNLVRIPVCYEVEYGADLPWIAGQKRISVEEIIQAHISRQYRIYMMGFLPGFAYMGEVDEKIIVPRKPQPQPILAGSVGIAGKQTGIYPLNSPGGWQIIGRTPLKMFDKNKNEAYLLKAGNYVEFYIITKDEFKSY